MYELLARYRVGATRRCSPARNARTVHRPRSGAAVEDEIVALRKQLSEQGLDAGAHTIQFHLMRRRRHRAVPSVATIWRVLRRHGFVTPNPRSDRAAPTTGCKPTCPNELWQADTTRWSLAEGLARPEPPSVRRTPAKRRAALVMETSSMSPSSQVPSAAATRSSRPTKATSEPLPTPSERGCWSRPSEPVPTSPR